MNYDINNIVRSVLFAGAVAPLTFALAGSLNTSAAEKRTEAEPTAAQVVIDEHRDALTKPCIDYSVSKNDSTLEREAKTTIDKYMGGEVVYSQVCNWVLELK